MPLFTRCDVCKGLATKFPGFASTLSRLGVGPLYSEFGYSYVADVLKRCKCLTECPDGIGCDAVWRCWPARRCCTSLAAERCCTSTPAVQTPSATSARRCICRRWLPRASTSPWRLRPSRGLVHFPGTRRPTLPIRCIVLPAPPRAHSLPPPRKICSRTGCRQPVPPPFFTGGPIHPHAHKPLTGMERK